MYMYMYVYMYMNQMSIHTVGDQLKPMRSYLAL